MGVLALLRRSNSKKALRLARTSVKFGSTFCCASFGSPASLLRIGMQSKLKILTSVWQVLAAIPKIYDVKRPDSDLDALGRAAEALLRIIEFPTQLGIDLVLPGACYGPWLDRLLVAALWPFAYSFCITCGQATKKMVKALLQGQFSELGFVAVLISGARSAIPLVLVITFALMPSTSASEPPILILADRVCGRKASLPSV